MSDCLFCKIARGEIDSSKIWEDDDFLAILDLFPNTKGMTLIIPKKHFDSDVFDMPDKDYQELMLASKKVANILEKGLNVKRVAMVFEGMGINHAHIKLYPLHGLKEKFIEGGTWADKEIYFDKFQGYVTTQLGPKKEEKELKELAEKIKKSIN